MGSTMEDPREPGARTPEQPPRSTGRREFLRLGGLGALALGLSQAGEAAEPFLVRSSRPQDLEPSPADLDADFTPNDVFFVRIHFGPPSMRIKEGWALRLDGLVAGPVALSLAALDRLPQYELPAVLQCSGNGRAFVRPPVPGAQWARGAVGQALWKGPRLRDVLAHAGLRPGARYVHLLGFDLPPMLTTPRFLRSIPLERAMHETTLVATRMNGEPLPHLHGGPARLVVPGWAGDHWVKWLREITVARDDAPGFYMQVAYRMPRGPVQPGQKIDPADETPVQELLVKSLFTRPTAGARLGAGVPVEIRGVAFAGMQGVQRVELSIDGSPWFDARLAPPGSLGSWQRFRAPWTPAVGRHTLRVRATDSRGVMQPEVSGWNPGGYLWNGIDVIEVAVS